MIKRRLVAGIAALAAGLTACTPSGSVAPTTPTTSAVAPFVVGTTDDVSTLDPAAATSALDHVVAHALFQRLMTMDPATGKITPDAAQDCLFSAPTVYECTLREDLRFHNGEPVTALDVQFSLQRALRLNIEGSGIAALSSLKTIQVPNETTVRFVLSWPDTQFGAALTSSAASIVPRASYDADALQPDGREAIGSGPLSGGASHEAARTFTAFADYEGPLQITEKSLVLRTYPDSRALEAALRDGSVKVAWRGFSSGADDRLQADHPGTRVSAPEAQLCQISWRRGSSHRLNAAVRARVASALDDDRTALSLLPPSAKDMVEAYTVAGTPTPVTTPSGSATSSAKPTPVPTTPQPRVALTMAHDADVAAEADAVQLLRSHLEQHGLSVRLVPMSEGSDLVYRCGSTFAASTVGWLSDYLAEPLPGSAAKLAVLDQRYRSVGDDAGRRAALVEIQKQAAADLTVIPVTVGPQVIDLASDVVTEENPYAPGWQPLLTAFHR